MYQDNLIITLNSKNATLMNSTLKSSVNFDFISILKEEDAHLLSDDVVGFFTSTPYRAFGKAALYFYPRPESTGKISSLADIHPSAQIGKNSGLHMYGTAPV